MRFDDDMLGERFYELYRVLFYPGLHERPAARMQGVRREQRAVRRVGPDDLKPLINETDMKRRVSIVLSTACFAPFRHDASGRLAPPLGFLFG